MSFGNSIQNLRAEQFTDDEILEDVLSLKPELAETVTKLRSEGFGVNEILDDIATLDFSGNSKDSSEKPKEKAGKLKSALYGAAEGILGLPALVQYGVNEWSKPFENMFGEPANLPFEKENPLMNTLSQFPESEDATSRYIRQGTAGVVGGLPFGAPGVVGGLSGSLAGQGVREAFGEEGKFNEFGLGETAAIGTDIFTGGLGALATDLGRNISKASAKASSQLFQNAESRLQKGNVRAVLRGDKGRLENQIAEASEAQLKQYEEALGKISPETIENIPATGTSNIKQQTENLQKEGFLGTLYPEQMTPDQGGSLLQNTAKKVFQENVINAEREAYNKASQAAQGISGEAPITVRMAKDLREELLRTTPTPEQNPTIHFLNGLIRDLEQETPAARLSASRVLDVNGNPLIAERIVPAAAMPRERQANDLVKMVQSGNQAINYDSQLREQSHRLKKIINQLRDETGQVLSKNPEASRLYREANLLHGVNAETWGTKFMRDLRFAENPEKIVSRLHQASNLRNLNEGISEARIRGLAERLVIDSITSGGSSDANRLAINNIIPELSPTARQVAKDMLALKDGLTTQGSRQAQVNGILKDVTQSLSTGIRPEKTLKLMKTAKGYQLVKESMNATPETRKVFKALERQVVEDIFSEFLDKGGRLDFNKIESVFKNKEIRDVVRQIGGDRLVKQFLDLEKMAKNFQRNSKLYSTPEAKSLMSKMVKEGWKLAAITPFLHMLHFPSALIGLVGVGRAGILASTPLFRELKDRILTNPKIFRALEQLSLADTAQKLEKSLFRLRDEIGEIGETS